MPNKKRPRQIEVTWETIPDPDSYALLQAVAMLFNRKPPLSTGADLTKHDEELSCRRPPEH